MMPVMVTPIVVMPMAIVADPARSVISPDHPAVAVRVIIIGRRVIKVPVKMMPVCEPESAVAEAATVESMTAMKPAAVEHGAAAVETTTMEAAAMKSASAMETAASMTSTAVPAAPVPSATMAATAAADFGGLPIRDVFCDRHSTGIDQRKRLSALAGCRRQHQRRGGREAERTDKATDNAAPWIWNLHHA
jgi:hypothetical protein